MDRTLAYRPDVDGLRAIAVLAVVFYHVAESRVPGGYTGVDIFFTISGYLITALIATEVAEGRFSFRRFYIRRIRRLFPALLATAAASLAGAVWYFPPGYLIEAAQSAVAAILSWANLFFYGEAGYWATDAVFKPLLHTWSLSVEEQFYLVWPLFIWLFMRRGRSKALGIVLAAITVVSVLATDAMTRRDADATFYLTPFRIFEFSIGALIHHYRHALMAGLARIGAAGGDLLFLAGAALVAWSVFGFTPETPFPGVATLVPAFGTAVLLAMSGSRLSSAALGNAAMAWLGRLSYSLYLTHWPILAFYRFDRYAALDSTKALSIKAAVALVTAAFVAAVALHYGIERPLRYGLKPTGGPRRHGRFLIGCAAAAAALVMVAGLASVQGGWVWRYRSEQIAAIVGRTLADINDERKQAWIELCGGSERTLCGQPEPGRHNVVILGDSQGVDGFNIVRAALPEANLIAMISDGCPPFFDLQGIRFGDEGCAEVNAVRFPVLFAMNGVTDVVVSTRIDSDRIVALEALVDALTAKGFRVGVLGDGPTYAVRVIDRLRRDSGTNIAKEVASALKVTSFAYDADLAAYIEARGGAYFAKKPILCPDGPCRVFTADGGDLVVFDFSHMTRTAAFELGQALAGRIREFFAAPDPAAAQSTDGSDLP